MTIVWTSGTSMTGLAADTKPTNVQTNTTFFETDTDLNFNFNGTTWDGVGGSMGDISFIHDKVLSGDWIEISDSTTTIEYIPASGKTFFLYSARSIYTPSLAAGVFNTNLVSQLLIDSVVKDKVKLGGAGQIGGSVNADNSNTNASMYSDVIFNVDGLNLVGDAIKKVEIDGGTSLFKTLRGWIEDT